MAVNKRFDKFNWNAELYKGYTEILNALAKAEEKVIKGIRVIGEAYDVGGLPYSETPFVTIDYSNENRPIPCCFIFEEPVCISFADGTTMEILPKEIDEWYIGFNSISEDIIDGVTNSNLDADVLLKKLKGKTINNVRCMEYETTELNTDNEEHPNGKGIKFIFMTWSSGPNPFQYGFSIEASSESFYFAMIHSNCFYSYGNRIASVSQKELDEALKTAYRQVPISKGHSEYSHCVIMPVKCTETNKEYEYDENISIEDIYVKEFLLYFLKRYINTKLTALYRDEPLYTGNNEEKAVFELGTEHNVYSYKDIKNMLKEMRFLSDLLFSDYGNPALNVIKKNFSYTTFLTDKDSRNWDYSEEEKQRIIRNNIYVAKDFYDRFIHHMEVMMKENPEYDAISFIIFIAP